MKGKLSLDKGVRFSTFIIYSACSCGNMSSSNGVEVRTKGFKGAHMNLKFKQKSCEIVHQHILDDNQY